MIHRKLLNVVYMKRKSMLNEPRSLMTWVFCIMSDKENDQINIKIPFLIRTTIGTHVLHINCPRHRIQNGQRLQYDRDDIGWVRDCCLTPNEQYFQLSWREQGTFNEMMILSVMYYTNTLNWIFIVLYHRYLWTGPYTVPPIAPPPFFNIDFLFMYIEEWRQSYRNGHLEIRKIKIKEANLFNKVGCCI
jgi:hypothetical protein